MIKRDSQNARILLHLAQGKSLTRYEAILMFRVQNITARIAELRKVVRSLPHGSFISVTEKTDPNGQTYAEYAMKCRDCRKAVGSYLSSLRRKRAA